MIYRELSITGKYYGFDNEITEIYDQLADVCAEWADSPELHVDVAISDAFHRFQELRKQHVELTEGVIQQFPRPLLSHYVC